MLQKGVIYSLTGAFWMSTMNLFIKFLGGTLPAGEIAFLRGFFRVCSGVFI